MKSIKKTALAASLNAGEVEINITITDENGNTKIPASIVFQNDTGADIGLLYIDSDEEKALRVTHPQYFDFLPLESGQTSGALPSSVKYIILTTLNATTATANLNLWTVGSTS